MFSKRTVIAAIGLAVVALLVATPAEYRWLALNSKRAEAHSLQLLSGQADPAPEWAWDLVIIKEKGTVSYARHGGDWVIAFSPVGPPQSEQLEWSHIWKRWYAARI